MPSKEEIRSKIKKSGVTKAFISKKLGISRQGLDYHIAGDGFVDEEVAQKILNVLSSNPQEEASMQNLKPVKGGHWYKVIYSIDAGDPVQIFREENYTGEEVFFPFGNEETCFPLKVVGDSMTCATGDSIPDGEYVLADLSETPLPGDVIVISLSAGRQMIKQYIEGPEDSITLRSFNPDYPDIIVRKIDVVKIIRVIGQGHFKRR